MNTELNTGGIIIAPSNVHTKALLEPAGDTQTQVELLRPLIFIVNHC